MPDACALCRFSRPYAGDGRVTCRRRAPVVGERPWPIVQGAAWCAEFEGDRAKGWAKPPLPPSPRLPMPRLAPPARRRGFLQWLFGL